MKRNLVYLYVAFAISLIIILLISFLFSQQINSLIKYNNSANNTNRVIDLIKRIQSELTDAENTQRGFLLTGDSAFFKTLNEQRKNIYPLLDTVKRAMVHNRRQQENLIKLKSIVAQRFQVFQETIRICKG